MRGESENGKDRTCVGDSDSDEFTCLGGMRGRKEDRRKGGVSAAVAGKVTRGGRA